MEFSLEKPFHFDDIYALEKNQQSFMMVMNMNL